MQTPSERTIWGAGPAFVTIAILGLGVVLTLDAAFAPATHLAWLPKSLAIALGALGMILGALVWLRAQRAIRAAFARDVLLTEGVFSLCRHPMTGSVIWLLTPGLGLALRMWPVVALAPALWVVARLLLPAEERRLEERFGDAYCTYASRTSRTLPHLGRLLGVLSPMPAARTGRVTEEVYAAGSRGMVSSFVLWDGVQGVAIDAGIDARGLTRALVRLGIDPARIGHVFLTHTDADHIGGLAALPQATAYVGEGERALLEGSLRRNPRAKQPSALGREPVFVQASQVIAVGRWRVQALAAPGHTPGSMVYLVNDAWLFTGDLYSLRDGAAGAFGRIFSMDFALQRETCRAIARRVPQARWLCTAHSGCTPHAQQALGAIE